MSLSFRIFNISGSALGAQSARLNAVAGSAKIESTDGALVITDARQLAASVVANTNSPDALYCVSVHPSAEGNTVGAQTEQAASAGSAQRYQAGSSLNNKQRRSLMTAVTE